MRIKCVVEFQDEPGTRAELRELLTTISGSHGEQVPGFLGSALYEVLDDLEGLVGIAEWTSPEAQAVAVEQAMADGVHAPVLELGAAPVRATRVALP